MNAEAQQALEQLRKELIGHFNTLKDKLEETYSGEFCRLTDLEEDYKWDSHGKVQKILSKIDPVFEKYKINPNGELPEWMNKLKKEISAGDPKNPRTCFQIIDIALGALL